MTRAATLALLFTILTFGGCNPAMPDRVNVHTREMVTENRTYYVRSDGADTNDCLSDSPGGACRTWGRAVQLVNQIDFGGKIVTIKHGEEASPVTFTEQLYLTGMTGGGELHIRGSSTPGHTVFSATSGDIIGLRSVITPVHLWDMTFDGGGSHIMVAYLSTVNLRDGLVFGPASFAHILVHDAQAMLIDVSVSTSITGSAPYHVFSNGGSAFIEYGEKALIGMPEFAAYLGIMNGGRIQTVGMEFVGAATGARYWVVGNSVLNAFNSGPNYLPGSLPGNAIDGGLYR